MPNWCENYVKFEGKKENIDRLEYALRSNYYMPYILKIEPEMEREKREEKERLFATNSKIISYELVERNTTEDEIILIYNIIVKSEEDTAHFYNVVPERAEDLLSPDWMDIRYHKLGTKWYPSDIVIKRTNNKIELTYCSAWVPALNIIKTISKDFNLEAENYYVEEGCCFYGIMMLDKEGNEISHDTTSDLPFERGRELVYEKINQMFE